MRRPLSSPLLEAWGTHPPAGAASSGGSVNDDFHELDSLFRRAGAGERRALADLLERLRPRLRRRAAGLLGKRLGRRVDASDIAQEVCLRVHGAFGQLEGRTVPQLLAWVEEVLHHALADCRKRHAARKRDAGREVAGGDLLPGLAADTTAPEQLGIPEALERVLRAGLAADPGSRRPLRRFVDQLRGALNQTLADALVQPAGAGAVPSPMDLRLVVSRQTGPDAWQPVAATHPKPGPLRRDMKKVPRPPEQVRLRTGDRVRVEVMADGEGFVTVFNVGPTGNLNLLYPDEAVSPGGSPDVRVGQPLHVVDVELEPPAGRERLFAVGSRQPLSLSAGHLHSLAEGGDGGSKPYRASRDMKRVQEAVRQAEPGDCKVVVVELEHAVAP